MNASAKSTAGEPGWTCKNEEWVDSYVSVAHDASGRVIGAGHVFKATTKYLTGIPWEDVLEEARDQYESSNPDKYNLFELTGLRAGVTY